MQSETPQPADLAAALRDSNSRTNLDEAEWRAAYDSVLAAALDVRAFDDFVEVVEVGINRLDARGRFVDVVALIDSALALIGDRRPDFRMRLLGMRATFERALGRTTAAFRTLEAAELARSCATDEVAIRRFDVDRAVCSLSGLTAEVGATERLVGACISADDHAHASLLVSWLAALCLARGQPSRARWWVQVLRAASEKQGHIWRAADAASLQHAIDARTYRGLSAGSSCEVGHNWVALRRLVILDLHAALIRRDFSTADACVDKLAKVRRSSPAQRAGEEAFAALASTYRGTPMIPTRPPEYVGLENLGAILAGAEAAALGGSAELAETWRNWLGANVPAEIVTAAEWPTSRARIEGLLALRAGDEAAALRHLATAAASADAEHYEIEADICRVQVAELTRSSQERAEAWHRLRTAGIDGAAVGYWVASSLSSGRAHRRAGVTSRELDVLRLAAGGLTSKEVGERLGLSPRTVSNHLQDIYEKLGAHSRVEALGLARAAGLI